MFCFSRQSSSWIPEYSSSADHDGGRSGSHRDPAVRRQRQADAERAVALELAASRRGI